MVLRWLTVLWLALILKPPACQGYGTQGELLRLIRQHPDQQHERLVCNTVLSQAAQHKAEEIQAKQIFDHTIDGVGANENVENHGYDLPDWYGEGDANNVESIGRGYVTAADVLDGFVGSAPHRAHILGEGDFYTHQEYIGVGHAHDEEAPYGFRNVWVVIISH